MCTALIFTVGCDGGDAPATDKVEEPTENGASLARGSEGDNEARTAITDGLYEGNFTVTYFGEPFPGLNEVEIGGVSVILEAGKFYCTANAERIPVPCEGSYSVSEGKITFFSESIHTHDFDGNLILHGEYEYTMQGGKLTFGANKNNVGYYEYALVKR